MRKRARFIVVALLLIAFTFVLWIEGKRGSQYRLGMTISEVGLLTARHYSVQKFGMEYDGQPTPQQMNEDPLFYIHDEASGILLMFNHHEKLIEKKRTKWFGVDIIKSGDEFRRRN